MLNPDPVMDATVTVIPVVLVFFTASVCVFLAPTATVPNDAVNGDEVSAEACAVFASRSDTTQTANKAATTERRRWMVLPGRMLIKKACWKTSQKPCRTNNPVLDKFMPDPAYGPRLSQIY